MKALADKLNRIESIGILLQQEIAELKEIIMGPKPIVETYDVIVVDGVPVSAKSTPPAISSEEKQLIDDVIEFKNTENDIREGLFKQIRGKDSIINMFLSPTVINGGRGFIRPIPAFMQYEEDISFLNPDRLMVFPAGFYMNRVTREIQLLIFTRSCIVCIDNLPGIEGNVRFMIADRSGYKTNELYKEASSEDLILLISQLEESFKELMSQCDFTS
jgi:hypothetical protein